MVFLIFQHSPETDYTVAQFNVPPSTVFLTVTL